MLGNHLARLAAGALIAMALGASALAAPADLARARIANYRALGDAFKAVNDGARRGDVQSPQVQQALRQIGAAAHDQYKWFPAGSGPQPGVKTAAKPEIWSDAKAFRAAQDAFARQAQSFQFVAVKGDAAAIRTEARKLGGACKSCHDNFRASND